MPLSIYKKRSETPLQCLERLRREQPHLKEEILSYAGRLDPAAEGVLLVLVGKEENQNREKYLSYDKEYVAEFVFGIGSDTHDLLGLVTKVHTVPLTTRDTAQAVKKLSGEHRLPYPAYSSKTFDGKPLFAYAREGTLDQIEIPVRTMRVYESALLGCGTISGTAILREGEHLTESVDGDFRQEKIRARWREVLDGEARVFPVVRVRIRCASGTYIRSLTGLLEKELGVPTLLMILVRTKVG